MAIIGKIPKTRVQFFDTETGKSRGITIQNLDFDTIYDNTTYFLEQLATYNEVRLISYGGLKNGKKTV